MALRKNWTRDELILAFNLYCEIPFGTIHNRNPKIIALARAIGRTPSALSWKLANFASFDPTLRERNIKGASNASKQDQAVWDEFQADWNGLAAESERLRLGLMGGEAEEEELELPEGRTREALVQVRVNQSFFRRAVLAAYDGTCCLTGIKMPELLCASHIVPWATDLKNRTNPANGLCLNALHDRAFDRGLITITPEFKVRVSSRLKAAGGSRLESVLLEYEGHGVRLPERFVPQPEFLAFHNERVFVG